MKKETITRIKLTASDGMILTDGTNYGKEIYLADTQNPDNWYEITEEEYAEVLKAEEKTIEGEV